MARAKGKEGHMVVKVFVIHDPSLPLASHKDKLEGTLILFLYILSVIRACFSLHLCVWELFVIGRENIK